MKLTMTATMCGPDGNAYPGTVMEIPEKRMTKVSDGDGKVTEVPLAQYMIDQKFARPFDSDKDRKARQGLVKAEK